MSLLPRQSKFIDEYLKSLNASEAYRKAYKVAKEHDYCDAKACRLMKNPNVKSVIESRKKELAEISKEDINIRLEKLYKNTTKDQTKLKVLEMQAKLNNLLTDKEIHQQTNIIDYSKLIESMNNKSSAKRIT